MNGRLRQSLNRDRFSSFLSYLRSCIGGKEGKFPRKTLTS